MLTPTPKPIFFPPIHPSKSISQGSLSHRDNIIPWAHSLAQSSPQGTCSPQAHPLLDDTHAPIFSPGIICPQITSFPPPHFLLKEPFPSSPLGHILFSIPSFPWEHIFSLAHLLLREHLFLGFTFSPITIHHWGHIFSSRHILSATLEELSFSCAHLQPCVTSSL